MRFPRQLLALVPALLLIGCTSAKASPKTLTVMTYNIHHAGGTDGKVDVERIAEVIKKSDADFVALQEVDNKTTRTGGVDQTAKLAKLTDMHAVFGKSMGFMGGQYGDAVLSRFPIVRHRVINLPWTDRNKHEPRAAVVTVCDTPAGKVVFVSTHLDHSGRPNDRLEQMKALVAELSAETDPLILGGDFNCEPDSEPLKVLNKSWLRATDDVPSIPSDHPKSKIDHVFVKPADRFRVIETHVVDEHVASDHRPVVVKLELLPQ